MEALRASSRIGGALPSRANGPDSAHEHWPKHVSVAMPMEGCHEARYCNVRLNGTLIDTLILAGYTPEGLRRSKMFTMEETNNGFYRQEKTNQKDRPADGEAYEII